MLYLKLALAPAIVRPSVSNLGSRDKPVQHRIESMMNIDYDRCLKEKNRKKVDGVV